MYILYRVSLTMNGPDLLFKYCTRELYEKSAHRRSRLYKYHFIFAPMEVLNRYEFLNHKNFPLEMLKDFAYLVLNSILKTLM
jgi:hypothetical protein